MSPLHALVNLTKYKLRSSSSQENAHEAAPCIASLPVETLIYIFELCLTEETIVASKWNPLPYTIPLSRVCKHWRTVILKSPSLWATISLAWPIGMVHMYLRNSKNAPIFVHYIETKCSHNDVEHERDAAVEMNISTVLSQPDPSSRIAGISLHIICAYTGVALSRSLSQFIPTALEFLSLSRVFILRLDNPWFKGQRPERLRQLEVSSTVLPLHSSLLSPSLTTLKLLTVAFSLTDTGAVIPRDCLLIDALRGLPALQYLTLSPVCAEEINFVTRNVSFQVQDTVALPCLKRLSVRDSVTHVADLLDWLEVPVSCAFDLTLRPMRRPRHSEAPRCRYYDEVSRTIAWIRHHCCPVPTASPSFESLSVEPRGLKLYYITFTLSGLVSGLDSTSSMTCLPTEVKLDVFNWTEPPMAKYPSYLTRMMSELPAMHNLQTLDVCRQDISLRGWVRDVAPSMPALESVCIRDVGTNEINAFVRALAHTSVPFPRLAYLIFEQVVCKNAVCKALREYMGRCRKKGRDVQVTLRACKVREEVVRMMREELGEVAIVGCT